MVLLDQSVCIICSASASNANKLRPISGVTFIILFISLDVHNPKTPFVKGFKAVDWLGSFFILAFTVMFLVGLELGGVTLP